jgi:MFS family permease
MSRFGHLASFRAPEYKTRRPPVCKDRDMQRSWLIFAVVSLFFFFVTAATFTSLGVVLFTMASELNWSMSAAGSSFAVLGLTCGLSSPLPALLMKWVGTRLTLLAGGATLAVGFGLASISHGLWEFMAATGLMGVGFTLAANIPGVYLLATWFPANAGRMIGFYFMAGALGGVFGPPAVNAIVEMSGWRTNWLIMAITAAVIGILSVFVVKDIAPVKTSEEVAAASAVPASAAPAPSASAAPPSSMPAAGGWTVGEALRTRQFAIIAVTMLVIQTVVTTIHGMLVTHLAGLGATRAFGAVVMGILGLTDSLAKGAVGTIAERVGARRLFVSGLALICVSVGLLGYAGSHAVACTFAVVFGIGWGASWLSAHLLLLDYFGRHIVASMVSTATLVTTFGIIGPIAAGFMADATGTFMPFFYLMIGLMILAAFVCGSMQAPKAAHAPVAHPPKAAQAISDDSLALPLQDRVQ